MAVFETDVLVIGAGPAGCIAGSLLHQAGFKVTLVEKQHFPRFVIGESLLPRCMDLLDEAGLMDAVKAQNFMIKNGAEFKRNDSTTVFRFSQQFTNGWSYTYQVPRADFDKALADAVEDKGIPILWGHGLTQVDFDDEGHSQSVLQDENGDEHQVNARFILDGSGYGRVLPRLLGLDAPSSLPVREALFTHITGDIRPEGEGEGRIWICMMNDPENAWMWIIPFSNGKTSVGIVAKPDYLAGFPEEPNERLKAVIQSSEATRNRLKDAEFVFPATSIGGYSISVTKLHGKGYALMGNATEFLDPVFSSGVTLAMESGSQAAKTLIRELNQEQPDWEREYTDHLMMGVDTFRTFVNAWYDDRLPFIFFNDKKERIFEEQICSVLAGYVWDDKNPFVSNSERSVNAIVKACELL